MMVVMKWAQRHVSSHLESKSLRDPLDGQVAKLLKFILIHNFTIYYLLLTFHCSLFTSEAPRYSSVFEYIPDWFE